MTLTPSAVDAYLHRLGASRPERATAEVLQELHERHVFAVPFETVDLALRRPVPTGADAVEKITGDHRGGCCYEVNSAFGELLRELGFEVDLLAARVFTHDDPGPLLGHLVLRVVAAGSPTPWLVDVGYGRGFQHPKAFLSREEQDDPQGPYHLADAECGDVELYRKGVLQYRIETRPRPIRDFAAMAWWQAHSPESVTADLFCSIMVPGGKITLAGGTLTRVEGARRSRVRLAGGEEIRSACRKWFGLELGELPPEYER